MKLKFIGVGEAFDELTPNTSILVQSKINLLIDCGVTTPHQFWRFNDDQEFLDAVFITHPHADHLFGLRSLLVRMTGEKRKKPIKLLFHSAIKEQVVWIIGGDKKSLTEKYPFPIELISVEHNQILELEDLTLTFAESHHIGDTTAVRIDCNGKSFSYSADGRASERGLQMYKNSDLLIQETYFEKEHIHGHANIPDAISYAETANIKNLALVHINRFTRRKHLNKIKQKIKDEPINIFIPETFDEYEF